MPPVIEPFLAKYEEVIPAFPKKWIRPDTVVRRDDFVESRGLGVQQGFFVRPSGKQEPLPGETLFLLILCSFALFPPEEFRQKPEVGEER